MKKIINGIRFRSLDVAHGIRVFVVTKNQKIILCPASSTGLL